MLRICVVLALVTCSFAGSIPTPEHPLATLRPAHPRIIATDADFARLRELVRKDTFAAKGYAAIKWHADQMLDQPTVVHRLIGPRLLDQSRLCLERVYTLALVYAIIGETKYLNRAVKELRAAAAFPDWNPSHFLDVAEMTHAFAIGYDWLFHDLSPEDRARFRTALTEKGLDEAIKIYRRHNWWTVVVHNSNQVCNGGITAAAVAMSDEGPERAEYIVKQSGDTCPLAMASYT